MMGQHPSRFSIHSHFAAFDIHVQRGMPDWLDPKTVLLPRLQQENSYVIAHFGKWHLSNSLIPDAPLPSAYGDETDTAQSLQHESIMHL
jgi:arylsulfatase A-like enzyme